MLLSLIDAFHDPPINEQLKDIRRYTFLGLIFRFKECSASFGPEQSIRHGGFHLMGGAGKWVLERAGVDVHAARHSYFG